jgi:hypothetical protein
VQLTAATCGLSRSLKARSVRRSACIRGRMEPIPQAAVRDSQLQHLCSLKLLATYAADNRAVLVHPLC